MLRSFFAATLGVLCVASVVAAQQPAAEALDDVSQQASALEAELGKYKDTTPEAAEAMVKLADLYHANGRVFGLIRASQRFVAAHPTDPRHRAMMLKLIDGLEAASRNQELGATCRQYLSRYPDTPEVPQIERRLAYTLEELNEPIVTADAWAAVWRRQPNANGRDAGARAIALYATSGDHAIIGKGAELGEQMVDVLPAGQFNWFIGSRAFHEWRRISQWAKSNVIGNKLLAKGMPQAPADQKILHRYMAENYGNQSQHANAVESYKKARALGDDPALHHQQIERMYHAGVTPQELEAVVNEYVQKYPTRPDRFTRLILLALSYNTAGDKPRAAQITASVLPFSAVYNSAASLYVGTVGSEPPHFAQAEQVLRDAINRNPDEAYYLRYVLAFDVYRDRIKDDARARQTIREMIDNSPGNDGHSWNVVSWLLSTAPTDADFQQDVARIIRSRRANFDYGYFRNTLSMWQQQVQNNKDVKPRADYVAAELQKADSDPLMKLALQWNPASPWNAEAAQAREQLLKPEIVGQLNPRQVKQLLSEQGYFYRHYVPGDQRPKSAEFYGELARRFPQEYDWALLYLTTATDYALPEIQKLAAENLLRFEPQALESDTWRRLMLAADRNMSADLVKRSFAWIQRAEQKFGKEANSAYSIGDILAKYEMQNEAVAYWRSYLDVSRDSHDSYYCATRLLPLLPEAEQLPFLQEMFKHESDFHGYWAMQLAGRALTANDLATFERVLRESKQRQDERPYRNWGMDPTTLTQWIHQFRTNKEATEAQRRQVYTVVRDMRVDWSAAVGQLALLELPPPDAQPAMARLLQYQEATRLAGDDSHRWDQLMTFAQAVVGNKDYSAAATLLTGMLSNIPNITPERKQTGRDMVAQSYARMGAVGMTIDENSPIAPLLQAALYLRLGDTALAFETYAANKALFNEHRSEVPVDLLVFVCESHIAAGGDENINFVEDVLRSWIVKNSENMQIEETTKAQIQLLLARNYFQSQRYDLARSEFTTALNRYPNTPQAIEADFGIGETFMAQKVYDQAETVFEKLANSRDTNVVVRAEFLRGVLTYRRGDKDEARDIFRAVLDRVPDVELANQALFNLAAVYGDEERYIDQLNLLRTVGRLGRASKRWHSPGTSLSIVVQDSDLGISRGHNKIPILVKTEPGGDEETIYLTSGGAGKGLFRGDLETTLGQPNKGDKTLQLTGRDVIRCDYPPEFKSEFKHVPLSDVEIRVASDAEFEMASSKIIDKNEETFSERLERESREAEAADERLSQGRPQDQIKPGNLVYLRTRDPDKDVSDEPDQIPVKLVASSGDQVQILLIETGPHTGIFEGTAQTGELPAGALATDTAIEHSPLMAIDKDPESYWLSEPDGATPKLLTVDMKDLKDVSRVRFTTPTVERHAPVRASLQGSDDGLYWFRISSHPELPEGLPIADEYGRMKRRVYPGGYTHFTQWTQIVNLGRNGQPLEDVEATDLSWQRAADAPDPTAHIGVIWFGKFIQERDGAVRIAVNGVTTAIAVDGRVELLPGPGGRHVDLWLDRGPHDLTIFAATTNASAGVSALFSRADHTQTQVVLRSFRESDFDLMQPAATEAATAQPEALAARQIPLGLDTVQVSKTTEQFGVQEQNGVKQLANWQNAADSVSWEFDAPHAGVYDVWFDYARAGNGGIYGVEFGTDLGQEVFGGQLLDTGGWDKNREARVGTVLIEAPGRYKLAIKPKDVQGTLMNLRGVTLKQAVGTRAIVQGRNWDFRFDPIGVRYVRFVVDEYLGEAVALSNVEVGGNEPAQKYIPTEADVLALSNNQTLEMAGGDVVVATYTDELTQSEFGRSRLLTGQLTATYFNASVIPIRWDFVERTPGVFDKYRRRLMRVDAGDRIIVEITDYDLDQSIEQDTIEFEVVVNDGEPIKYTATETENYSGIFTKEVDTSAKDEPDKLKVQPGDRLYIRYTDAQNTFPGHSVPRESVVYVRQPSQGLVRLLETRVAPAPAGSDAPPQISYRLPATEDDAMSGIAFEAPLTVEVIDPDAARDSASSVTVTLTTTDGATVDVRCVVSDAFAAPQQAGTEDWELQDGRFIGQAILQLGGKNSPQLVPLSSEMPRNLVGGPVMGDEQSALDRSLTTRVLNLTGKDTIKASYNDEFRPKGAAKPLVAQGRLITNGALAVVDREYENPITQLHVGEKLFLMVTDADRDTSDERDSVKVEIETEFGERETIELFETLAHSGVFTGSVTLKPNDKPTPENLTADQPLVESYFGDVLRLKYTDETAATEAGTLELSAEIPVVIGTDGLVAAFSKTFNDEKLAVETKFHIAESYFELFKSHKKLARKDEQTSDLEAGRRVLHEVMEDYPDPKYVPRIAYLLGQFAQELGQWGEAIEAYEMILQQYPDHPLAADAQYKLAQAHEESGHFDDALEAYVTLAATYPKSPLIANVMIRISDHFYKKEQYDVAAQVGEKFIEKFDAHEFASRIAFRVGQCYFKAKQFSKAGLAFDFFSKQFPEGDLCPDALFWAGESYRMGNDNREAYRRYNRCRWDYPESESAKYARGRLALPEMLQQFEADANSIDTQ